MFFSLLPPFVLLLGWLALGEMPTTLQLTGLAIVLVGFRLTQKAERAQPVALLPRSMATKAACITPNLAANVSSRAVKIVGAGRQPMPASP